MFLHPESPRCYGTMELICARLQRQEKLHDVGHAPKVGRVCCLLIGLCMADTCVQVKTKLPE